LANGDVHDQFWASSLIESQKGKDIMTIACTVSSVASTKFFATAEPKLFFAMFVQTCIPTLRILAQSKEN
jgi:hypothetical protein